MARHYHSINTSASGQSATPDRGMGDGWSFTYSDTLTVKRGQLRDMVHRHGRATELRLGIHERQQPLLHHAPTVFGTLVYNGTGRLHLDGHDRRHDEVGRQRPAVEHRRPLRRRRVYFLRGRRRRISDKVQRMLDNAVAPRSATSSSPTRAATSPPSPTFRPAATPPGEPGSTATIPLGDWRLVSVTAPITGSDAA